MFYSYEKARKALEKHPLQESTVALLDVDGVVNSVKNLHFHELPITALATLQGVFREINFLTGRYAHLFANQGIPALVANGFDFSRPFGYRAEMGGVNIYLAQGHLPIKGRDLMLQILDSDNKGYVACSDKNYHFWTAEAVAPAIAPNTRDLIWEATKKVLAQAAKNGELEQYGFSGSDPVDTWASLVYNRELENITKGTVTTSRVATEYADAARAINDLLGERIATEINLALEEFNSGREQKLRAVAHLEAGCVEVLFDGVDKFNTAKTMILDMEQRAGRSIETVVTFGDSFPDTQMAVAAKALGKQSIHFHFGHSESFIKILEKEPLENRPHHCVLFPAFDFMYENNSGMASVNTSGAAMWWLIEELGQDSCDSWSQVISGLAKKTLVVSQNG